MDAMVRPGRLSRQGDVFTPLTPLRGRDDRRTDRDGRTDRQTDRQRQLHKAAAAWA